MTRNYILYSSIIGDLQIISDGKYLKEIRFAEEHIFCLDYVEREDDVIIATKKWLDDYFHGLVPEFLPPMKPDGTPFQNDVWQELIKIPYANLTTYGDIAKVIASKNNILSMSAQAIGGAVGKNPIPIIIPCHRVIGKNRSLTGYRGGIDKKELLLKCEGVDISHFKTPKK